MRSQLPLTRRKPHMTILVKSLINLRHELLTSAELKSWINLIRHEPLPSVGLKSRAKIIRHRPLPNIDTRFIRAASLSSISQISRRFSTQMRSRHMHSQVFTWTLNKVNTFPSPVLRDAVNLLFYRFSVSSIRLPRESTF